MSRLRPDVSSQKSQRTKRILFITLASVLALSGVALSTSAALRAKLGLTVASKPQVAPQPRKSARPRNDLLRVAGIDRTERSFSLTAPPVAPTVTATKADSLFADGDSDNLADPGDTIKYTVNISAAGDTATGVTFTDNVDPNTTFVPGSVTATPVAVDDNYTALGNVRISVPAPGVLGNDFAGVPSATITAPPVTSANGGNVTLNADGSFTYNPPPGFEGSDTFTYTLTNAAGSNNATVTISVSGMIWFIDNNASCPCDGRLTNPFNTLASFQAVNNGAGNNPAANDNIFVYESATDYVGPVTLLNNQKFIGQDASVSLTSITGLTPPVGSDPLPTTNSANATIVNITSAATGITVGSGNRLIGFTGGNAVTDIAGSAFGTLTISDVTLNGNGQALNLTNGTLAATIASISSTNSATTGVTLVTVGGSLTSGSTSITNPTGIGISVNTSSASLNFGNTTSNASGAAGVSLLTNTGAITFGSLSIAPDANQRGLIATDNTNTITTTSGTITNTNLTAVQVTRAAGTTPLNMTLTSVSNSGGVQNGIILTNTSGSFTITGTGTAGSGGTIATKTGANGSTTQGSGIFLTNVTNASFSSMQLNGFQNFGIRGTTVTGFTLFNTIINGTNGNNAAAGAEEGAVRFDGLFGSASITDSTLGGTGAGNTSFSDDLRVINGSGTLNRLTITNTNFGDIGSTGNNDLTFIANNNGTVMNLTVQDSFLTNAIGSNANITANQNSQMDIVARRNKFSNNNPNQVSGGGNLTLQSGSGNSTVTYDMSCNTFRDAIGIALLVAKGNGAGTFAGSIVNNTVGVSGVGSSGSTQASGIKVKATGGGTHTTLLRDNVIRETNEEGIYIQNNDGSAVMHASLFGNTVTDPGPFSFAGLYVDCGALATDTSVINIVVGSAGTAADKNDFSNGDPFDFSDVFIANNAAGTQINLSKNGSGSATVAGVIDDDNLNPAATAGFPSGTINLVNTLPSTPPAVAACTLPSAAAFAPETGGAQFSEDSEARKNNDTDVLFAAEGKSAEGQQAAELSQDELNAMLPAALERWRAAGISLDDLARLQAVTFEVADLPDNQLATANGNTVKIDVTAAGYGWYSDISPTEDSEFGVPVSDREMQVIDSSPAFGHVDLLTVVTRELGVTFKQNATNMTRQMRSLMQNTLSPGVRRVPDARKVSRVVVPAQDEKAAAAGKGATSHSTTSASAASIGKAETAVRSGKLMNHAAAMSRTAAAAPSMFADVSLNIGTLPAGESVTITFNATVNDPFTGGSPQVSNQGTVSGSNFANVLTDDPDVGGTADPTVTPIDLPQVSVAVSPGSVAEDGATNLVYTFTRSGSTTNPMTVNFNVGGSASFTEPDYTQTGAATFSASSGTVVIPGGSSTAAVTIDPSADTTVEPDETVDLTVTSGVGYTVGSPSNATGTITNDDTDVSLTVSPASVTEDGATNLVYTFTRAGVTTNSLTVNFSIAVGGTNATFPTDYSESGSTTFAPPVGSVTFAPGSSTAMVTIDPVADSIIEPDETVTFTVTAGAGYNVSSPSTATGTITNDDAEITVAVAPSSVTEDGPTNLVYTFTRTGFTGGPLLVNFSVGGTAVFSEPDYSQSGAATYTDTSGTVLFGIGSTAVQVTIDPTADANPEPDETVTLTVAAGTGYTAGSPNSATGTILNDDTIVSVTVSPATTAEGGANIVYTFTRTGSTASAVTVNFSVGGTASFPADYSQSGAASFAPPNATVTIGAGNSSANVTVTPLSDCDVEAAETVQFTVQPGTGYGVGSPSSATGTINNTPDSTAPTITLIPNVNMTLWPPNHQYVSVSVADFVASASDNCDATVNLNSVYITKITSDEAENGNGDGNTLNDIIIGGTCKTAQLRSERDGGGDGRVYTITFKVKDASGNFTTATAKVTVRKNPGTPAVDSGTAYTVNSSCP